LSTDYILCGCFLRHDFTSCSRFHVNFHSSKCIIWDNNSSVRHYKFIKKNSRKRLYSQCCMLSFRKIILSVFLSWNKDLDFEHLWHISGTYSEYKSIRTEKIFFNKTLFLKIKYYPANESPNWCRINIDTMISTPIWHWFDV